MLRRALVVILAISPAVLPTTSLAYDIKPKTPDSGFAAKQRPDILGISTDSSAESARAIFEQAFKGHADAKTDVLQKKFGGSAISYVAALNATLPSGPKRNGEVLSTSFSSPASANSAFFVSRDLTFAPDQQPLKAEMIKQIMDKYGAPTIIGDQHLYFIYRAGKIVSLGVTYKDAGALEAIDKPLDPRTAIKLNAANGRGSCVAAVKRTQAKDKTLSAMLDEAKAANCDGALSVQLTSGVAADRLGNAQFTLLDFKRIISAAAIDDEALAAEKDERGPLPKGSTPKL